MTTVFGNPGSTELPMLEAFPEDFAYVLALQEASAVGMADGFALATGNAAFVNLHTAPGVGNAMAAIETARANRAPLVVTAGQQTREMLALEPYLANRAPAELPRPAVKWSSEPARAQDVPAALERAYHLAMQHPRGPTFVSVPMDDWGAPAGPRAPARAVAHRVAPDPDAIAAFAVALDGARAPALVVGPGVDADGAYADVVALAERLGALAFQSPVSPRSSFPQDHPAYRGYLPPALAPLAERLAPHDVVCVLGAPVFAYYPYVPGPVVAPGTRLLHVATDPDEAARAPVAESLQADTGLAVRALLAALGPGARPLPEAAPAPAPPAGDGLSTGRLFATLAAAAPVDAVMVNEAPASMPEFHERVAARRPGSFYSTGSGGLGYAMPAAVGIALADPGRAVVCVVGEGSACYSPQALYTAAQQRAPVLFLVVDNAEYAILKAFAGRLGVAGAPGLDLPGLDLVALAAGFGVAGRRVEDAGALDAALAQAMAVTREERRPFLLDVAVAS
jgi:benzoylformate decarboxylase